MIQAQVVPSPDSHSAKHFGITTGMASCEPSSTSRLGSRIVCSCLEPSKPSSEVVMDPVGCFRKSQYEASWTHGLLQHVFTVDGF